MIWVIGNKGMLGRELSEALSAAGIPHVGSDRDLSILEPRGLEDFGRMAGSAWIVNCAAYTAVDRAEDEPDAAAALNAEGPEVLGRVAAAIGARALHISTDYVFGAGGSVPFREDDPVSPVGVYARTKAAGESRLLAVAPNAVVLRTAWLYGRHGPNFVSTMLRLMGEREELGVVADQYGSPTWARDLARAIVAIVRPQTSIPAGVYHFTDEGAISWYDFAIAIERKARELGLLSRPCHVRPITSAEYPTKAQRPSYSVLSKEKIKAALGLSIPPWEDSLRNFLIDLGEAHGTRI
jgi:dTDP-4-dehydrorhamnose reductase